MTVWCKILVQTQKFAKLDSPWLDLPQNMQLCLQTKLIRELFKNMCSFHLIYMHKFCRFTLMFGVKFELTDLLCVKHLTL